MPPNQPAPTPPPAGHYDFIMADPQPQRSKLPGGKRQLAIVAGLGVGAIVAIIIVLSLVFGGSKDASAEIISAVIQQQELARLSLQARTKASDPNTRAIAATANAVLSSDAGSLKNYLTKSGNKVSAKQLISPDVKSNDATLSSAAARNHFDEVYLSLLKSNIKSYQTTLSTAYDASGSKAKTVLRSANKNGEIITSSQILSTASRTEQ